MPYRFTHREGFTDALHRIGVEQIERACTALQNETPDKAVHETRKCIKRLRALLRLVRAGIGETAFDRENARLREISRALSGARDRTVLLATITRLSATHPQVRHLKSALQKDLLDPSTAPPQAAAGTLQRSAAIALREARVAWEDLALAPDTFAPLAEGLARGLRQLRENLKEANGDDATAHEWRKAAQRHWRHMRLLEAGWPSYFSVRALEAKIISDLLGDAQDLALLVHWVEALPVKTLSQAKARAVIEIAQQEQTALRDEARLRTQRLVAEGAEAHGRRAALYWKTSGALPEPAKAAAHEAEPPPRKRSKAGPSPARSPRSKARSTQGDRKSPRSRKPQNQ